MGHEGLVSNEYTLNKIQLAQSSTRVTKLELEDVINRKEDPTEIFAAIRVLLSDERNWLYIKFIDSIQLRDDGRGMDAATQFDKYANNRQSLWNHIRDQANGKPIMFQVKLEVAADTSIRSVEKMLAVLIDLDILTSVDCGGALYAVRKPDIPNKLAELCRDNDDHDGDDEDLYLREMIALSLTCTPPETTPVNNASAFLKACLGKLKKLHSIVPEPHSPSPNKRSDTNNGVQRHHKQIVTLDTTKEVKSQKHQVRGGDKTSGTSRIRNSSPGERRRMSPMSPKRTHTREHDPRASKNDEISHSDRGYAKSSVRTEATPDYDWTHKSGSSPKRSTTTEPDFRWDKPV